MQIQNKNISGWGNFPKKKAIIITPNNVADIQLALNKYQQILPRGAAKSYGDSSLFHTVLNMKKMDAILAESLDWIEVEAGISLQKINETIVPKGKFMPVTPGISGITIGGAIASNVHGKNHHLKGSICNYILSFKLINEIGIIINCSTSENADKFYETFGGMGTTGIIISAKLKLIEIKFPYLLEHQTIVHSIEELYDAFEQNKTSSFIVAWIDLLNKDFTGILKTAEWLNKSDSIKNLNNKKLKINIPFLFPFPPPKFLFKWYNKKVINKAKNELEHQIYFEDFFYPLDKIKNWNKIYGPNGFLQYHAVMPYSTGFQGIEAICHAVKNSAAVCTLAVIKLFGKENKLAINSFPQAGFNIAIDMANNKAGKILMNELDLITKQFGGSIYKTKDAISNIPKPLLTTKFQSDQNIRYAANQNK